MEEKKENIIVFLPDGVRHTFTIGVNNVKEIGVADGDNNHDFCAITYEDNSRECYSGMPYIYFEP